MTLRTIGVITLYNNTKYTTLSQKIQKIKTKKTVHWRVADTMDYTA